MNINYIKPMLMYNKFKEYIIKNKKNQTYKPTSKDFNSESLVKLHNIIKNETPDQNKSDIDDVKINHFISTSILVNKALTNLYETLDLLFLNFNLKGIR